MYFNGGIFAQTFVAKATLDTNSILIGDQINLNIEFTSSQNNVVIWPLFNDTITNEIEIIGKSEIDTIITEQQDLITLKQILKITSFDSGYYEIPPVKFIYREKNDTATYNVFTAPLFLNVLTIPVDTTKAMMPIKGPISAPYTLREAVPWILIGVGVLLIGLFLFYYFRKRKKKEPLFKLKPKPKIPPHVIALNALEKLRINKLWQSGKIKEYHTEITDIIRVYIHDRFGIDAMEMTTNEILESFNKKSEKVDDRLKNKLKQTLMLADLVKFAKEKPLPLENDKSLNNSIDFVKETIRKIENNTEGKKVE
jgi:LPXTG-motif cell wall-anchored protein